MYIATPEDVQPDIGKQLKKYGFNNNHNTQYMFYKNINDNETAYQNTDGLFVISEGEQEFSYIR